MGFLATVLLYVATTVVSALITAHTNLPHASALGDFVIPTAQEGRAIPVVFGTAMIKGGNTVWWGDLKAVKYKPHTIGGFLTFGLLEFTGFFDQVRGYKYYLGCQFALCQGPVDALVGIQADVKALTYSLTTILNGDGSENYIELAVNSPNFFGGTTLGGDGGISGTIDFYRGLKTQQPDDYLTAKQNRIVTDQSGIGDTFSGVGNGTISSLVAGSAALDETITITAAGIDGNFTHSTFQKMKFNVVGSVSGTIINSEPNADGSRSCWADQAFSGKSGPYRFHHRHGKHAVRGRRRFHREDPAFASLSRVSRAVPGGFQAALHRHVELSETDGIRGAALPGWAGAGSVDRKHQWRRKSGARDLRCADECRLGHGHSAGAHRSRQLHGRGHDPCHRGPGRLDAVRYPGDRRQPHRRNSPPRRRAALHRPCHGVVDAEVRARRLHGLDAAHPDRR